MLVDVVGHVGYFRCSKNKDLEQKLDIRTFQKMFFFMLEFHFPKVTELVKSHSLRSAPVIFWALSSSVFV